MNFVVFEIIKVFFLIRKTKKKGRPINININKINHNDNNIKTMSPKDNAKVPKSAYPKAFKDFDSSLIDDSIEGDISLSREFETGSNSITAPSAEDLNSITDGDDDDSFDDLLESPNSSRHNSIFKELVPPKPRGYEFKLKNSNCMVYLTYPVTNIEIDNYGKIDYELHTKDHAMVVIIPNSKGLSVNNQKLADAYAIRTGCVTAVLDIYFNDVLDIPSPPAAEKQQSFIDKFKNLTVEMATNVKVNYWIQSHSIFGSFHEGKFQSTSNWEIVKKAIDELLTTHEVSNAVLIGFSFGCNAVLRTAIENEGSDDRIKSFIVVHPLLIPNNVFKFVNKSTLLITGPEDSFYSASDLQKYEHDLKAKKNPDFKYIQLGSSRKKTIPHGFAIAGDYPPMKVSNLPTISAQHITSWILQHI